MRALLITLGSYGDVLPFVALGKGLSARGHSVTLVTNGYFRSLVESAGLGFLPLGGEDLYKTVRDHPDMWHPMRGFKVVFGVAVGPLLGEMLRIIRREHVPGETVVIGSSLALSVRIAEEKWGFTCCSVHLQPSIFRSVIDPPKMNGLYLPGWMPRSWKRRIWLTGDKYYVDPVISPALNALRAEHGLPSVSNVLDRWWHCEKLAIGMFPDWYAPPPADWPEQVRLVGFPLHDVRGEGEMPAELEAFLVAGEKPIAFTPGSAMAQGRRFFETAAAVCRRLNRRGILLTLHGDQIPADLPADVIHVDYAPFSSLLPRCAALVHHGGIGSTSQALRAGVPQLIMPLSHDQPDNANRVKRLGVGDWLSVRRFTPRRVAGALGRLLSSQAVGARCGEIAGRFEGMDAVGEACGLIERLHANAEIRK